MLLLWFISQFAFFYWKREEGVSWNKESQDAKSKHNNGKKDLVCKAYLMLRIAWLKFSTLNLIKYYITVPAVFRSRHQIFLSYVLWLIRQSRRNEGLFRILFVKWPFTVHRLISRKNVFFLRSHAVLQNFSSLLAVTSLHNSYFNLTFAANKFFLFWLTHWRKKKKKRKEEICIKAAKPSTALRRVTNISIF